MRNIIEFLWRNYFFFLFIILEIIAVFIIINNNYYQGRVVINSTNDFSGSLLKTTDNLKKYLSLKKANVILAEENARFYNMSPESFIKTDTLKVFIEDLEYNKQYRYYAAGVISNSINRRNNYMKLDKGARHGLQPDMAVLAPNGVVGQIIEVSENFSSVMTIINTNLRISAKHKKSGQVGSLTWDGRDYRSGTLSDIPSHAEINIGDSIVTSGFSYIYPEGQLIGLVDDFYIKTGENFFTVDVQFAVDYNKIFHVYAVENILRDELLELEEKDIKE
jgi:rod shape-determining protein MreC